MEVWQDVKLPEGKVLIRASSATPPTWWSIRAGRRAHHPLPKVVGREKCAGGHRLRLLRRGRSHRPRPSSIRVGKARALAAGARRQANSSGTEPAALALLRTTCDRAERPAPVTKQEQRSAEDRDVLRKCCTADHLRSRYSSAVREPVAR